MAKKNTAPKSATKAQAEPSVNSMPFGRKNYTLMLAGVGLLALGFIIMAAESSEYGFGPLGLTVGPLLLMAGFILEVYAILAKPKDTTEEQQDS